MLVKQGFLKGVRGDCDGSYIQRCSQVCPQGFGLCKANIVNELQTVFQAAGLFIHHWVQMANNEYFNELENRVATPELSTSLSTKNP
jgi:hypothetical protein